MCCGRFVAATAHHFRFGIRKHRSLLSAPTSDNALRRRGSFSQLADQLLHALVVRSLPVNSIARGTRLEFRLSLPHSRRKLRFNLRFLNRPQQFVAAEAARKGRNRAKQVKSVKNFDQLSPRLRLPHPVPVSYRAPLQQIAIASEQDPSFRPRDAREPLVAAVVSP